MTIWLLEIEGHEQRYTKEWQVHLPLLLARAASERGRSDDIRVVTGQLSTQGTTAGAFLNFAATNIFKASQIEAVARHFQSGDVKAGDTFLVTDAWHPGIIQIRYMSDLLGIPVRLFGLWHAGGYDPADFLGRIKDKRWTAHFERALFQAIDVNCFATEFHINMFKQALGVDDDARILQCGWPMEYLSEALAPFANRPKRNLVLFPHRLAPEKQVEIFRSLADEIPDYDFVVCQDEKLNKGDYHQLLGQASVVFSASLQGTLGIGLYEGLVCGAVPFAPDRLSYSEIYGSNGGRDKYLYPSEWTESWQAYQENKAALAARLKTALSNAAGIRETGGLLKIASQIRKKYFDASALLDAIYR